MKPYTPGCKSEPLIAKIHSAVQMANLTDSRTVRCREPFIVAERGLLLLGPEGRLASHAAAAAATAAGGHLQAKAPFAAAGAAIAAAVEAAKVQPVGDLGR